jgi:hypothetical protein
MIIRKLWMIAWDMWQNRNQKEHEDDANNELEKVRTTIEEEIGKGFEDLKEIDMFMFTEEEIQRVREGNIGYARAWLRNLMARRGYAKRLKEDTRDIQLMRANMRRFLNLAI